jgi:hypothetical protein
LSTFKMILKTFSESFESASVWLFTESDALIVGSPEPMRIDYGLLARRLSECDEKLRKIGFTTAPEVLSRCIGIDAGFKDALAAVKVNSLEHPYIEFYSFREYAVHFEIRYYMNLAFLAKMRGPQYNGPEMTGLTNEEREEVAQAYRSRGEEFIASLKKRTGPRLPSR